jgi:hypothetical protein
MICANCSAGADEITLAKKYLDDPETPPAMLKLVLKWIAAGVEKHKACTGCFCQHKPRTA